MGLFTAPSDVADSYMSVGYGLGKIPFYQDTYDSLQGYSVGSAEKPPYSMKKLDSFTNQQAQQRYDPLNLYDPFSMPQQEPILNKQPSTLEALRQRSKPLYMGLDRVESQDYRQTDPTQSERMLAGQMDPSMNGESPVPGSEFSVQFKKLKPFNQNNYLRMLEKNNRGTEPKNEDE